ncbi:hypothetical protein E2C01_081606 [Portunus trituberculatus]|uniref:Uncharacterized protein n=1 Tax=Portunus trituberculatus TaxID=210409 RepID=A0A5B7IQ78_PORTR|nr:hypothetical protein [Portunus trituberculatus]
MHFTSSDYKNDLKHRLLGTEAPKSYKPLTDTAVPSLNLPQVKKREGEEITGSKDGQVKVSIVSDGKV